MLAAKKDANQTEIVEYLRKKGASVQLLHAVGKGCPDLLVGWSGWNLLMEIKIPKAKGQQAGKLTDDQVKWHGGWKGKVGIVYTTEDVERMLDTKQEHRPTDRIGRQTALEPKCGKLVNTRVEHGLPTK